MKTVRSIILLSCLLLFSCQKEIVSATVHRVVQIDAWGDSLTFGQGSTDGETYPLDLQNLSGIKVINYGISGQTSTQICNRMLNDSLPGQAAVIWVGRNNYGDPVQVKKDIDSMVKKLGHNRYLILGVTNGDEWNEYKGNPGYQLIVVLNNDLASVYGEHFIDIRSFLVSNYDKSNSTDSANMANDVIPASLRYDFLHLNNKGYQLVAEKINQKISLLKY